MRILMGLRCCLSPFPVLSVCHTIVDGLRDSLREELPTAMGCFRTVFPCYLLSVAKDDRGPEFTRIFKVVRALCDLARW